MELTALNHGGGDVFNFTLDTAPQNIIDVMNYARTSKEEISLFAIHQANKQIVEAVATKAQIPLERTPSDVFTKYGNTSVNTIPMVLTDKLDKVINGKFLLSGFGVGLSWGSVILDMENVYNGGVQFFQSNAFETISKAEWINKFRGVN